MNFWNFIGLASRTEISELKNDIKVLNSNLEKLSLTSATDTDIAALGQKIENEILESEKLSKRQFSDLCECMESMKSTILENHRDVFEDNKATIEKLSTSVPTKKALSQLSNSINDGRNENGNGLAKIDAELNDVIILLKSLIIQDINRELQDFNDDLKKKGKNK